MARRAPGTLKKQKRHSPEEIIKKLREAEELIAAGEVVEVAMRATPLAEIVANNWQTRKRGDFNYSLQPISERSAPPGARTRNQLIKSQLLYH